jgi:hypothetical protein
MMGEAAGAVLEAESSRGAEEYASTDTRLEVACIDGPIVWLVKLVGELCEEVTETVFVTYEPASDMQVIEYLPGLLDSKVPLTFGVISVVYSLSVSCVVMWHDCTLLELQETVYGAALKTDEF